MPDEPVVSRVAESCHIHGDTVFRRLRSRSQKHAEQMPGLITLRRLSLHRELALGEFSNAEATIVGLPARREVEDTLVGEGYTSHHKHRGS
jgi:hypothetical protein